MNNIEIDNLLRLAGQLADKAHQVKNSDIYTLSDTIIELAIALANYNRAIINLTLEEDETIK